MAAPALIQQQVSSTGSAIPAFGTAPTVGNLLVAWISRRDGPAPAVPAGFTLAGTVSNWLGWERGGSLVYRVVQIGDPNGWTTSLGTVVTMMEWRATWAGVVGLTNSVPSSSDMQCGAGVTPPTGGPVVIIGGATIGNGDQDFDAWPDPTSKLTPDAGVTELADVWPGGYSPMHWCGYRAVATPSGSYSVGGALVQARAYCGVSAVLTELDPAPGAGFSAFPTNGDAPLPVQFTDESSGGALTSWAWTFGDGDTSSAQDPLHVYAAPGLYSVSLTVGDGTDTDELTRSSYINVRDAGYVAPAPAGALLEIFAASPGSSRWGLAYWGAGAWSDAAWQDVTPEGISANVRWGAGRGELGILSRPEAGTWSITTYDPARRLDPANAAGDWAADLVPGLPIRLSHRGVVIRQGIAEAIGYSYKDTGGYIRVTDLIATLANAEVESDSTLPDTLYARARAAISAAGLAALVLPDPPTGDPAVHKWSQTGPNDWSVWQWISDAAEDALHVPYIDRLGRLGFRAWASPLNRGRSINAPQLVDLQPISSYQGLFAVVRALQDAPGGAGSIVERRVTPLPRYGARPYERAEATLDASAWSVAILADRAWPSLRWVPADVYPLTADDVERFATLEAVELVTMADTAVTPPVSAAAIIVGGRISVTGKLGDAALWRFSFEAAATATTALIVDGSDPDDPVYVLAEAGDEFLYPG